MRLLAFAISVLFFYVQTISAQTTPTMKGKVLDYNSQKELNSVSVKIIDTNLLAETDSFGLFKLENLPIGIHYLEVVLTDYEPQKIPITISEIKDYDIGIIYLSPVFDVVQESKFIVLSDDDLLDDDQSSDNVAGLFQSSKDIYLKAAAYNFSQAWFKVRGYDSSYGLVSINGIEMNKLYDNRPQWSNWGGLNDVFRNQESSNGIAASDVHFGNVLGVTNFSTRASDYREGSKVSVSATNKSYTSRLMASYASGLTKNNWAYVVSGSRRMAQEGYMEGTSYNAWAGFLAVEKKLSNKHSFNFTAFTAPNRRGKSSPNTQEVFDLKGSTYNAYWGEQEGELRNSRMKEIVEPVLMLSHYFETDKASLNTTVAYQFGHIGNSRLGYNKAPNPDPTYWKYLPSNFLRFDMPDYKNAYLATQNFKEDGQINWNSVYQLNNNQQNALYYLYEDRVDDRQFSANSTLNTVLTKHINLTAGINFKLLKSNNYSNMLDLLGSDGFMDLDQYALGDAQQNDLNNKNRVIDKGEMFQYHYGISAQTLSAFTQLEAVYKNVDYFVALQLKNTNYLREGFYKNGSYPLNSEGKSEQLNFLDPSVKGGITYKITGRNLLNVNAAYISNAATIRNSFSNARVNNAISPDLSSEKIVSGDISYVYRSPKLKTRLTTYYTEFKKGIETSFFFAEGILGDQVDFVNEIITGVEKRNFGVEFGVEYQLLPTFKLFTTGSVGQFTYNNNPQLYLLSDNFVDENSNFGTSYLKNYRQSGTPQKALAFGFEYQDPAYWWFQLNGSLLGNNYVDVSPLLRTNNFYNDENGVPLIDDETGVEITQQQVKSLLVQEKFDDAFLLDIVGGKSWKINDTYTGFFMGINNVLGEFFKTGGFEQSRKANYPALKEDKQLNKPIFGPKYWYGSKTSYYLNVYVRF